MEKQDIETTETTEKDAKPKKKSKRYVGCLTIRSGNQTMAEAAKLPTPKTLYPHLVFEGECSCLFSDTNTGKSIFAVQIGCEIAKQGLVVAYYDFELSLVQFRNRYSDIDGFYRFPDTFYRIETTPSDTAYSGNMLADIEEAAVRIEAKVLIIDNITWLCADSEDGASASTFMKEIKRLQKKHDWTIIVIAHTPKRNDAYPITVNDLAGSKQFANFFDSIYALGRCNTIKNVRYLKQVKIRAEESTYSADAVLTLSIEKKDHMLQMIDQGQMEEKYMLFDDERMEEEQYIDSIKEMATIGMTDKEIAANTGETLAKVKRITRGIRVRSNTNRIEQKQTEDDDSSSDTIQGK